MTAWSKNLLFLQERSGLTRTALAKGLDINRSTLTRTLDGKIKQPSYDLIGEFARYFRVSKSDLYKDNKDFIEMIEARHTQLPLLSFTAVELHRSKWEDFYRRIKGRYLLYYGKTGDGCAIVSLLDFVQLTDLGVEVRVYNPYRHGDDLSCYEYRGVAYPVNELIYIFAEQLNGNDYEILSLILMLGRTPTIGVIEGLIQGVGVKEGTSMVAANPLICVRAKKQDGIVTRKCLKELGCGFVPFGKLAAGLQKRLDEKTMQQKIRLDPR